LASIFGIDPAVKNIPSNTIEATLCSNYNVGASFFDIFFGLGRNHEMNLRAKNSSLQQRDLCSMLSLEPTASLVMRWALPLYEKSPARIFVRQLDLSSGEELYSRCDAICPWYEEVIQNRKSFIKKIIERRLDICGTCQLVVLAAGQSPLSLELALERPSQISQAFEVDISGMEEKARLYAETFPKHQRKLQCLTGDITSEGLLPLLEKSGYAKDGPSIVLMEGISYYLPRLALQKLISHFGSGGRSIIVIEYLLPCSDIEPSRRRIPREIFSLVERSAGLKELSCYTRDDLREIFRGAGGELLESWSMKDMEKERCKKNLYFPERGLGWIECSIGSV
jgi:O-methyltransferase involved in polyketide biosynthesis